MIRETGNMWSVFDTADYFLVTTNSYIRNDGELVMGRGIARQAKRRFPGLSAILGDRIQHLSLYGLEITEVSDLTAWIGAFQVKRHYMYPAETDIIKYATGKLKALAEQFPRVRYDLNFPGIGCGKLTKDQVTPIIEVLPDNVHVWTFR